MAHHPPRPQGGAAARAGGCRAQEKRFPLDEKQFRLIVEHIGDLIAVLDRSGRRLYNSPSYRNVLDEPEALQGTNSFKEIHPEDRTRVQQAFSETVRTGQGRRIEYRFLRKDGQIRHIESQGDAVRDGSGKFSRVIVVSRDVTERKQREEEIRTAYRNLKEAQAQLVQSEKLASVGQFASGIVHDVRNPLNVILLSADYLKEALAPSGDGRTQEAVRAIQEAVLRANRLVQDLLNFARRDDLKLTPEPLHPVIENALERVERAQPLGDAQLLTALAPTSPQVPMDAAKMQQVLINLVTNAIQAMPQGGRVQVRTLLQEAGENTPRTGTQGSDFFKWGDPVAVVEVADTGAGIPQENLEKIFEPFFTTKPKGEGTGLGLAIVRSIVEAHHGVIEVFSQPGKGTTFRLTLPCAP